MREGAPRSRELYERAVRGAERGAENEPDRVAAFISKDLFEDYLKPRLDAGEPVRIVDIGVGHGRNSVFLAEQGCEVIGVEPSAKNREAVTQVVAAQHLESRVKIVAGLSAELPVADASVDAVVAQGAAFLLDGTQESARRYMSESVRVLKPGGVLALVVRSVRDQESPRRLIIPVKEGEGLTAGELYDRPSDFNPENEVENMVAPNTEVLRHYFSQDEINLLLDEAGFEIVYQKEENTRGGSTWTWRTIARKKESASN